MYDLGCMLVESRPFAVLDGLPGLYGLKYDSATACGLSLYLCSYKLVGSAIVRLAQTMHLSYTDTNTVSKRIENRLNMTHVT